jgi:hypothetical protein
MLYLVSEAVTIVNKPLCIVEAKDETEALRIAKEAHKHTYINPNLVVKTQEQTSIKDWDKVRRSPFKTHCLPMSEGLISTVKPQLEYYDR